jgi:spore maturation protein SpmB
MYRATKPIDFSSTDARRGVVEIFFFRNVVGLSAAPRVVSRQTLPTNEVGDVGLRRLLSGSGAIGVYADDDDVKRTKTIET